MLIVTVDTKRLEYDIHSLVKAFYPEKTVKVLLTPIGEEAEPAERPFMEIALHKSKPLLTIWEREADRKKEYELSGSLSEMDGEDKISPALKNVFKKELYQALSDFTDRVLPWGNLTGIRPTKIAVGMLSEGKTDTQIAAFMKENHFAGEEKTRLAIGIAHRETELLKPLHVRDGYSLYIGIPFCPTTCLYCSFTSYPICAYEGMVEEYLDCVIKEMNYVAEAYRNKTLDSVYIGGGTPTTLLPHQLDRLLSHLEEAFDLSGLLEFTVEAGRADSITKEKLEVLKKHGISRISVNPQTMKDETLRLIGRQHTVEQVREAFYQARELGFDNINMDLILGLPGEDVLDVQHTMDEIVKLEPDSLTVHSLAVKRASRLRRWIDENGMDALKNTDETMEVAAAGAKRLGMEPYYLYRQKNMSGNFENVGYAKPGKYGIYNILIMEEVQTIMALGAGSISKIVLPGGRIERADNVKDVKLYMEKMDEMLSRKEALFQLQKDEGWLG